MNGLREVKRRWEYRLGRYAKFVQFLVVGTTGAVVDLGSLTAFSQFLSWSFSRALAIWLATTWVFWLNRRLTFSYAKAGNPWGQYARFCGSYAFGGTVNWSVSLVVLTFGPALPYQSLAAAACGILAGLGFNFTFSNYLVFRVATPRSLD